MATQASIDAVQKLFIAFYQRPADVTGLEYWANRVDAANGDTSAVVNAFATSAEATALYPATLSTTQLVNNVYQALFGRAPDAAGLNFYANAIAAGTMTPGKLAQNILDGATGTDATIIANKLTVAKAYTAAMDTTAEILAYNGNNGNNALANAKALLGTVTALDISVTNATGQIPNIMVNNVNNAAVTPTPAGTAFTFTSGIDSYTGTTNADSVSGAIADIGATDVVVGGAGTTAAVADTLTLTTAGALNFVTTGAGVTGFEKLVLANGTNTITLATAIEDSAGAALTDGNWSTITGGTGSDTLVVRIDSTANLTTVTGIEQITLDDGTVGGAAADITFVGAAANSITILSTEAGSAIVGSAFNDSITVAGNHAKTVNGGAGTDTITLNGTQAASVVTITNVENVIGHAGADSVTIGAVAGTINFTNVETVTGGTAANTVNFGTSTVGVTYQHNALGLTDTINLNASNGVADTVAFNAAGVTAVTANTDKLTVNGFTVANDVIRLDLAQTTANNASVVIQSVNAVPTGPVTFTTTAGSEVLALNFDLGGVGNNVIGNDLTGATILANFGGQTLSATASTGGYLVAYDAGNAYLYSVTNDATAALTAAEISLIGVFNGVAVGGLQVANFTQAA